MSCFDKLKIVTSINYIKEIDETKFQSVSINERLQYHKYQQKIPSNLLIMVNYEKNELVIEFTSKILKDKFIHLINKDTIYECFHNINQLGICILDIENIINHSEVVKCDVTKDVIFHNVKELEKYVKSNLANYDKWKCKPYRNGFVLKNVANTPHSKKRIVVYNKGKELKRAENKSFLDSLDNDNAIQYFDNKVRIETNINTKIQIRQFLDIQDNELMSVLNSNTNPILTILDEAIKETSANSHIDSLTDYKNELLLKECNYDLSQVEAIVRLYCSKNTSIKKTMQPYRELYHQLQENKTPTFDIKKLVA
jgi:hypothetical protein